MCHCIEFGCSFGFICVVLAFFVRFWSGETEKCCWITAADKWREGCTCNQILLLKCVRVTSDVMMSSFAFDSSAWSSCVSFFNCATSFCELIASLWFIWRFRLCCRIGVYQNCSHYWRNTINWKLWSLDSLTVRSVCFFPADLTLWSCNLSRQVLVLLTSSSLPLAV